MSGRRILVLISVIVLSLVIVLLVDFRTVDLEYVGKGSILELQAPYGDLDFLCTQINGRSLSKRLCERLNHFKHLDHSEECTIVWENNPKIKDDENYFVCVGCEIERITYRYHTKFFISMNNPPDEITYFSGGFQSLKPLKLKNAVTVYRNNSGITLVP